MQSLCGTGYASGFPFEVESVRDRKHFPMADFFGAAPRRGLIGHWSARQTFWRLNFEAEDTGIASATQGAPLENLGGALPKLARGCSACRAGRQTARFARDFSD